MADTNFAERILFGEIGDRVHLLGGSGAEDATLAKIVGPGFTEDGVVDAVERAVEKYREIRKPGERFLDTYRRVGVEPFKEAIYV